MIDGQRDFGTVAAAEVLADQSRKLIQQSHALTEAEAEAARAVLQLEAFTGEAAAARAAMEAAQAKALELRARVQGLEAKLAEQETPAEEPETVQAPTETPSLTPDADEPRPWWKRMLGA